MRRWLRRILHPSFREQVESLVEPPYARYSRFLDEHQLNLDGEITEREQYAYHLGASFALSDLVNQL